MHDASGYLIISSIYFCASILADMVGIAQGRPAEVVPGSSLHPWFLRSPCVVEASFAEMESRSTKSRVESEISHQRGPMMANERPWREDYLDVE
jgi:hypothetical protein